MLTASFVSTTLVTTLLVGAAVSAWLWTVYRRRQVIAGGLRALAGMRWREFSRFVIEALQQQGFEASRIEPDANLGQQADLLLNRDGETWLLSCKQGVNYRVNATMVDELALAVRGSEASGGILTTLGRIEPDARKQNQGIELMDGASLWTLIDPLLPPSLHRELVAQARAKASRNVAVAWVGALVVGLAMATLFSTSVEPLDAAPGVAASSPTAASRAAKAAPELPAEAVVVSPEDGPPDSTEAQQRAEITRSVSVLPGVETASWSTRSTLLVHLRPDASQVQVEAICTVVERSELLGASRVQLQPPPDSGSPVRFIQCRTY